MARSNISDDNRFRVFISGDTMQGDKGKSPCVLIKSKYGDDDEIQTLVKEDLPRPVVVRSNIKELDTNNIRYTRFFQTWVDALGYESGASLPSQNIKENSKDMDFEYNDGDVVTVKSISPDKTPHLAVKRRIYKVITGTEKESIQFIYEQDVTIGQEGKSFLDVSISIKDEDAGEIMPMFKSPPDDLVWMTYVENGFYCGFRDSNRRRIMFSEINMPSTWPDAYEYSISDDIVGIATVSNAVYVMTEGNPWILSGTSPDAMTVSRVGVSYSCVSPRSICTYNNSVFYASNVGVCMFNANGVINLTDKLWTKEQWLDLNPSKSLMAEHDGTLFMWFMDNNNNIPLGSYALDLTETDGALTTNDEVAVCVCRDLETDTLYYVRRDA